MKKYKKGQKDDKKHDDFTHILENVKAQLQDQQQKELQIQLQNQLIKQQDQTSNKILHEITKISQPQPLQLKSPFIIIDTLDLDLDKKAQIAMFIANSSSNNKNEVKLNKEEEAEKAPSFLFES
ncbi:hypothetical protein [Peribacillus simplex]|uniref:hypothetical protein n=1 Tax=Peribacillus simplex TaxID=1478 RepID=UPI002852FB40|nr:hypothetical protein [Peribacillus simplex]MDR4926337.1 hypothetical protein [Peribacillus simplex]